MKTKKSDERRMKEKMEEYERVKHTKRCFSVRNNDVIQMEDSTKKTQKIEHEKKKKKRQKKRRNRKKGKIPQKKTFKKRYSCQTQKK